MVGIAADHAVGVGEMVEEAAGWIVFPGKGRCQTFQIRPNHAAFGVVVKMGVLHGTGSKHQAAAGRTAKGIVFFLKRAFHGSKGSVLNHVAVNIVGAFPDAGGVPDVGHLSDVVVGELPSWRIVTVGDGDKFSGERSIGVGSDDSSGFGQRLQTVKFIVSLDCGGAVGIGLFHFQSRGFVIEPRGGISVGWVGRIRGNVSLICPEGSQGNHMVGFIVGEACGLNGGAVLGYLSAAP